MPASPDRFIRMPEIKRRLALGKTKIYDLIKEGEFPAPVKVGRASCWPEQAVIQWQAQRLNG